MGFIVSAPTYVYQSPSGYIFRIRIPNDLTMVVGKSEFGYFLRSRLLSAAKQRARSIASFVHQGTCLVRKYIKDILGNDERCRSLDEYQIQTIPQCDTRREPPVINPYS